MLPSWAPDWRLPWKAAILDPQFANQKAGLSFSAAKGTRVSGESLSSCEKKLHVKGFTVDHVRACYMFTDDDVSDMASSMLSFLSHVLSYLSATRLEPENIYIRTRESCLQALVRTISADSIKLRADILSDDDFPESIHRSNEIELPLDLDFTERQRQRFKHLNANPSIFLPWIGGPGHVATIFNSLGFHDPSIDYSVQFINHIKNLLNGRVVFLTESGYLGLGPDDLQAGDTVHVLVGGDMLFALRATQGSEHNLVGECYLHGFMDGSMIDGDGSDEKFEQFVLV